MPSVPLTALRAFEAVARHLSFTAGARELNVSTAAVSSQIRLLEERLNQKLFRRQGRQISLTGAGRKLLPGVSRGMRELQQAVQRLDADRSGGALNISMMPSFLQKWLMPRLASFQESYPEIDLRISADDSQVDFSSSDFHAAVRFGPGSWPELEAVKVLEDWILPVCSPRYLEQHGALSQAEDLQAHKLLYVDSPIWDAWFRIVGEFGRQKRQRLLNDATTILMAAELGEGIALTRWSLAARDIEAGRLVRPLPAIVPTDWSYYLVAPAHQFEMPKVASFQRWLKNQAAQFDPPSGSKERSVSAVDTTSRHPR